MQELIPKLTDRDYVMCFWQAAGGHFAWLVERGDQLYLFTVLAMIQLSVRHWAYKGDRSQVDIVRNTIATMGFHEIPIYAPYRNAKEQLKPLLDDFKAYEETRKQRHEEQQQLKKAKEEEAVSNEKSSPKNKVTFNADARKEPGDSKGTGDTPKEKGI